MKNYVFKQVNILSWVAILLFSILLASCTRDETPELSENPVVFSAEAQTKEIRVEYLHRIESNSDYVNTDKKIEDLVGLFILENDWVKYTINSYGIGGGVKIDVQPNTSSQPRTHKINVCSRVGTSVTLTVTQNGK